MTSLHFFYILHIFYVYPHFVPPLNGENHVIFPFLRITKMEKISPLISPPQKKTLVSTSESRCGYMFSTQSSLGLMTSDGNTCSKRYGFDENNNNIWVELIHRILDSRIAT